MITNEHTAPWLAAMREIEAEPPYRDADPVFERAERLVQIGNELAHLGVRASQLRADLYATEARIGELRGEFAALAGELP
jgi:hypothetical protein